MSRHFIPYPGNQLVMSDDFSARYRLLKCVLVDDGIRTHNAQEMPSGRVVMVHIADAAGPDEVDALRAQLAALAAPARTKVLEAATVPYGFAVVTEFLPTPFTFRSWLEANTESPPAEVSHADQTVPETAPPASAEEESTAIAVPDGSALPGSFSAIFGKPVVKDEPEMVLHPLPSSSHIGVDLSEQAPLTTSAQVPPETSSAVAPSVAPAIAASPASPAVPVTPPPSVTPVSPPTPKSEPGEFTRMFAPSAPPPTESAASSAPAGDEIQPIIAPVSHAPPHLAQSPFAPPLPPLPPPITPAASPPVASVEPPLVPADVPPEAPPTPAVPPPMSLMDSMGFADSPAAKPPARKPPGEFTLMFGAPETAAPLPDSMRPSPMHSAPPPAFSPLTPEQRLESPPVVPLHHVVSNNPNYMAGIQQDGPSPIAPNVVGGSQFGFPSRMPAPPAPPPAHASPLVASNPRGDGDFSSPKPGILPPPIFNQGGGATPLSALGGAAPLVNASAGPSEFTRLISSAPEPVVPPLAPARTVAPGVGSTSSARRMPTGLIVAINAVLLIAALLMFFVLRRPIPTAQTVIPAKPVMPSVPSAPQIPTTPPPR